MNKQAPSIGQLITIAGFALSCFGLLLFVWVTFGGPTPLAASGYHLKLPLTQINQLAEQSEVKISGVAIGHVTKVELGEGDEYGSAIVTLEIEPEYAPVPVDTRAILRAKSLLGETYVELTPGEKRDGLLEDGDTLPAAQVAKSVQLDEIFRTFDPETREAFKQGAIDNSIAMLNRGATMNQTLGVLPGTLTEVDDVLTILDEQDQELSKLIRNTGVVFDAISRRQGQLSGLIRNSNTVFSTTADRNQELQDFFRIFPTFLRESRLTQQRLGDFSALGTPIMNKFTPVARQLSPTFKASAALAPTSKRLYTNLKPVIRKAPKAFPSLRGFLDNEAPRLLARIPDYFNEFNPFLQTISYYRLELAAFLGNAAAATNATQGFVGEQVNYVRAGVTIGPETLTAYPDRLTTNRSNPYMTAGTNLDFASGGLAQFDASNCAAGLNATIQPWAGLTPIQQAQYTNNLRYPFTPAEAEEQYENVIDFALGGNLQTNNVAAPACIQQAPFEPIGDPSQLPTQYQQVFRETD